MRKIFRIICLLIAFLSSSFISGDSLPLQEVEHKHVIYKPISYGRRSGWRGNYRYVKPIIPETSSEQPDVKTSTSKGWRRKLGTYGRDPRDPAYGWKVIPSYSFHRQRKL